MDERSVNGWCCPTEKFMGTFAKWLEQQQWRQQFIFVLWSAPAVILCWFSLWRVSTLRIGWSIQTNTKRWLRYSFWNYFQTCEW
jgi:hypothetical protein